MGRILKRVPLDFSYPLHQLWEGYCNPYLPKQCISCSGSGYNAQTKKLSDDWYTFLRTDGEEGWRYHLDQNEVNELIKHGRLMEFTRVPLNDEQRKIVEFQKKNGGSPWLPFNNGYIPTANEVNIWAREGHAHDGVNQDICVKTRAKRLGFYGLCPVCHGEGQIWNSEEEKVKFEKWVPFDPPDGAGYQLWENTSEGSPVSPVFEALESLCEWCETNATFFAGIKLSKQDWLKSFTDENFYVELN